MNARVISETTPEFQRCIQLAGKDQYLSSANNYTAFRDSFARICVYQQGLLIIPKPGVWTVTDQLKMQQCFIDVLKSNPTYTPTP